MAIAYQARGAVQSKTALVNLFKDFANAGVDTMITEMEIKTTPPVSDTERADQMKRWKNFMEGCLTAGTRCKGIVTWGFTDDDKYLENASAETRASYEALLFKANFEAKSPVETLKSLLLGL